MTRAQPLVSYADERRHFCFDPVVDLFLSFLSAPNLRGRSVNRLQMLTRVRWWPQFIKLGQKFGEPPPKEIDGPTTSKFGPNLGQLDREYLQNETRYRFKLQSLLRMGT